MHWASWNLSTASLEKLENDEDRSIERASSANKCAWKLQRIKAEERHEARWDSDLIADLKPPLLAALGNRIRQDREGGGRESADARTGRVRAPRPNLGAQCQLTKCATNGVAIQAGAHSYLLRSNYIYAAALAHATRLPSFQMKGFRCNVVDGTNILEGQGLRDNALDYRNVRESLGSEDCDAPAVSVPVATCDQRVSHELPHPVSQCSSRKQL
eukprot:9489805-Pyramimonas_sp.AAC.1